MKFYHWCFVGLISIAVSYRVVNFDLASSHKSKESILGHLKRDYLTSRGLLLLELSIALSDDFKGRKELDRSLLEDLYKGVHGYDFRSKEFALKVLSNFLQKTDQSFVDSILLDSFTLPNDIIILLNASTTNPNIVVTEAVYKFLLERVNGHLALAESLILAMKVHNVIFSDEYYQNLMSSVSSSDKSILCGYMNMYKLRECSGHE